MNKVIILDTNVLLTSPDAILSFPNETIILPLVVIEELDKQKSRQDDVGKNAREVTRRLSALMTESSIKDGIQLKNGGILKILSMMDISGENTLLGIDLDVSKNDNLILVFCKKLQKIEPNLVLVSLDLNMRIKGETLGIPCEEYKKAGIVNQDEVYTGIKTEFIGEIDVNAFHSADPYYLTEEFVKANNIMPNQFLIFKNVFNQSGMARYIDLKTPLKKINESKTVWGLKPKNKEQAFAIDLLLDDDVKLVTLMGIAGGGKAQPLHSKILTPTGWTTMGEIKPNDLVIGQDGKSVKVVSVHPQGIKDIFKVIFSDGSSTECCEEHLWMTKTQRNRDYKKDGSVKSLKEIMGSLREVCNATVKRNHSIPMVKPIDFETVDVPLDPYLLGALIGDGGFSQKTVYFTTSDLEILEKIELRLPNSCKLTKTKDNKYDYRISHKNHIQSYRQNTKFQLISPKGEFVDVKSVMEFSESNKFHYSSVYNLINGKFQQLKGWKFGKKYDFDKPKKNEIIEGLKTLGLMGHKSDKKFIPNVYKYNNFNIRLEILQGLMDTDGFIDSIGKSVVYYTTSEQLAKDVQEIVWSFGGKAVIANKQTQFTYKGIKKNGLPSFAVYISMPANIVPVTLKRKLDRFVPRTKYQPTRYIDKVEYVGKQEAQCIYIDSPDHLYITDDYIVTHNTLLAIGAALEQIINQKKYKRVIITRSLVEIGRPIGALPGNLESKMSPYLQGFRDNLEFLLNSDKDKESAKEKGAVFKKKKLNSDESDSFGSSSPIIQQLVESGVVQLEAMNFIRGRSLADTIIILDESQNCNLHEIRSLLTRCGNNSKIICTADISQIDNYSLDASTNGFSIVVDKFRDQPISGHIRLVRGERSLLATIASEILV